MTRFALSSLLCLVASLAQAAGFQRIEVPAIGQHLDCDHDEALHGGRAAWQFTWCKPPTRVQREVILLLSLAFLAPDLVKAIVDNRMPRGVGLTSLVDLPSVWGKQWKALGLLALT